MGHLPLAPGPLTSGLLAWCTSLEGKGDKEAHHPATAPIFFSTERDIYHLLENLMTKAINLVTNLTLASVTVCWAGQGFQAPGHISHSVRVPHGYQTRLLV